MICKYCFKKIVHTRIPGVYKHVEATPCRYSPLIYMENGMIIERVENK
jgi:hypothetical protein